MDQILKGSFAYFSECMINVLGSEVSLLLVCDDNGVSLGPNSGLSSDLIW